MSCPDVLENLLQAAGPSGQEIEAAQAWREAASFATVHADTMGSSYAEVAGTDQDAPRIALFSHIDEIGLVVTHISDEGMLHVAGVGGWDPQNLIGQRVRLLTKHGPVSGVVGRKAIHLLKEDEEKSVPAVKDLYIDLGASDGEAARALARVGDVAVLDVAPLQLQGERLVSRALDNRLGAYVVLEAARRLSEDPPAATATAVAAVQEEIGLNGARPAAYRLSPDCAVVVDVCHATDTPGVEVKHIGEHKLGSGCVITRGATLHPQLAELLIDAADEEGIPYTLMSSAAHTGTDADAVHIIRSGVPCALVSIPLRYMHSPVEMCDLRDVEAAVALLVAATRRLNAGSDFVR